MKLFREVVYFLAGSSASSFATGQYYQHPVGAGGWYPLDSSFQHPLYGYGAGTGFYYYY